MLILNFLYSIIDKSDHTSLYKLKEKFLPPKEKNYLTFVQDFYATHSKLPDISTVEGKFNIKLKKNPEPATYWYDEIYKSFQNSVIEDAVINSARNKGDAIEIFQQAIADHNSDIDVVVSKYSDGSSRMKAYIERKTNKGITNLSTGMDELDTMSLGYKKADLWTIGGRESIGKTWQLLKMADALDNWMIQAGIKRPILIVSGEMTSEELEERLDSIRCQISYQRLTRGELKPGEERKFNRYLNGFESNIIIIDSFDGLNDVDFFITLYRPAMVFIDGSHLLAPSYDWKDIAQVTARMKKMTRNNKVPILNTTHLKAERGTSAQGGNLDDFAYTKGYTRDSDIVGVMFASDLMELDNLVGVDWLKVRRGNLSRTVWHSDHEKGITKLHENLTGKELASAKIGDDGSGKGTYATKQTEIY